MDKIIILDMKPGTGLGDTTLRYLFRFAITAARRVPKPGAVSEYRDAVTGDNDKLASGEEIEEVYEIQLPSGTTQAQAKSLLETRWTARDTAIGSLPNPNQYYGTKWNGTAWA